MRLPNDPLGSSVLTPAPAAFVCACVLHTSKSLPPKTRKTSGKNSFDVPIPVPFCIDGDVGVGVVRVASGRGSWYTRPQWTERPPRRQLIGGLKLLVIHFTDNIGCYQKVVRNLAQQFVSKSDIVPKRKLFTGADLWDRGSISIVYI